MTEQNFCYAGEENNEPYHYTECGLDDVYLRGGVERLETEHGPAVSVKNADELHQAIGLNLVLTKKVLNGKELRYLRKELDLTQAELGVFVGLSSQQVARWEKEQYEIPSASDHLLRVLYLEHVGEVINVRELVQTLEASDADIADGKQEFVRTEDGWKAAA